MEEIRSVSRFINSRSRSQDRIQKGKGDGALRVKADGKPKQIRG